MASPFSEEVRAAAVARLVDESVAEVAASLGVSHVTIHNWRKALREDPEPAPVSDDHADYHEHFEVPAHPYAAAPKPATVQVIVTDKGAGKIATASGKANAGDTLDLPLAAANRFTSNGYVRPA